MGIKFDDVNSYKKFLPTAPYVLSLYGDTPEQIVGVFEVSYPMPETAISSINGMLKEQGASPTEAKIGDYSAYIMAVEKSVHWFSKTS